MDLERAQESLHAAQLCLQEGLANSAASRAYYAMFQAAQVAMAIAGFPRNEWSHAGLQAAFANELIHRRKIYPAVGMTKIGDIRTVFLVQMSQFLFLCLDLPGLPERQKRPSGREQKQDILPLSTYPDFHHPTRQYSAITSLLGFAHGMLPTMGWKG